MFLLIFFLNQLQKKRKKFFFRDIIIIFFVEMDLLNQSSLQGERPSFSYYGKKIIVPLIGDILFIMYNSDFYYMLVTKVQQKPGKTGTIITGLNLQQKGFSAGSMGPAFIKSRSDFSIAEPVKSFDINPKDRKINMTFKIYDF